MNTTGGSGRSGALPLLEVGASGCCQRLARRRKISKRPYLSDAALLVQIRAAHTANRGAYDWPRIWRQLLRQTIRVGNRRWLPLITGAVCR